MKRIKDDLRGGVQPTPIGIKCNAAGVGGAGPARRACFPGERRMNFSGLGADLLGTHDGEER